MEQTEEFRTFFAQQLEELVTPLPHGQAVISSPELLSVFESDALTLFRQLPWLVVFPGNTAEVSKVLAHCAQHGVPVVARGAGTGLSGGALPHETGVLMVMARFDQILEVDNENMVARVQPGVKNLTVSEQVDELGLFYAPDPSSQIICSVGGNVAENSGGVHCLKYGMTTNNILGLEVVLMDGEILRIGGKHGSQAGLDLLGALCGSEGLLGVVTEILVRLTPKPEQTETVLAGFASVTDASNTVAAIIAAGITPAGCEMMDAHTISAVRGMVRTEYPKNAQAVLIVEIDGCEEQVAEDMTLLHSIFATHGALMVSTATNDEERADLWKGRKMAFPALGKVASDYICMDGTIPRGKLATVLDAIAEASAELGLKVANVFHAGDGNLHPLILFDSAVEGESERALQLGADILKLCVAHGGALSGEHGIGIEKRALMPEAFTEIDLEVQQRLKCAFDPQSLLNPGKVFPQLRRCAELGFMHVHAGNVPYPDIPRF